MPPLKLAFALAAAWSTSVFLAAARQETAPQASPTFNKDVAPILFSTCVTCHRPGAAAPMSLLTFEDARPYARAIKAKTVTREMPPWPADPQFGRFRNHHPLTDADIQTLSAWADAGSPRGDGSAPTAPVFVDGWSMDRPPDAVIESPFEFELPAEGQIPAFSVWLKIPFRGEKFVEAIEMQPTSRAVVHHSSVTLARLPAGAKLGRGPVWPGGPVLDGVPILRNGQPAAPSSMPESFGKPLLFYVPGGGFVRFPRAVAKRIAPDDYIVWGFHFITSGKPERTGARVGVWFSREKVKHEVLTWTATEKLAVNGKEVPRDKAGRTAIPPIAPHDREYTMSGEMRVAEDITLYALWPHMHFRGRDMTFTLVDRRGREQVLLSVPRYDAQWQLTYELDTPLKIQAGSTIKAVAHYDNSAANRHNPDPAQTVVWGPQASNEMFGPFLELVFDKRGVGGPDEPPADCNTFGQPLPSDLPGAGVLPPPCRP